MKRTRRESENILQIKFTILNFSVQTGFDPSIRINFLSRHGSS